MATKCKRKSTKIALNLVLCKKSRNFPANSRVIVVRKLKCAIPIFMEQMALPWQPNLGKNKPKMK